VESCFATLEGCASKFNDKGLAPSNKKNDPPEHSITKDSFENVLFIVDESSCNQTKDLLTHEHVEDYGHLPAGSVNRLVFAPKRFSLPACKHSRIQVGDLGSIESPENHRFRDKILSSKHN